MARGKEEAESKHVVERGNIHPSAPPFRNMIIGSIGVAMGIMVGLMVSKVGVMSLFLIIPIILGLYGLTLEELEESK